MEKAKKRGRARILSIWGFGFHHQMAYASFLILIFNIVGFKLTHTYVPNLGAVAIGCALLIVVVLPLPVYLYQKRRSYWFESVLTVLWTAVVYGLLHLTVVAAGRFGARFPLYDSGFAHLDRILGIYVPGIKAWAAYHWIGQLTSRSYALLPQMLVLSVLAPIIAGRLECTQEFVVANIWAFAIGLPFFALFPAVGPWYGFHFPPESAQAACQTTFLLLRASKHYAYSSAAGLVCFPSFHVIWAILSARALWVFRYLRIPVAVLSGVMMFSTLTTGWHYFCDVLAGILVAGISTLIAGWLLRLSVSVGEAKDLELQEVALD